MCVEFSKRTIRSIFLGVAGCILLYWFLHETERVNAVFSALRRITAPFVVGAAIAFILNVPMRGIERGLKGIKRPALRRFCAIFLTFAAIVLVLALVFTLLIPQLEKTIGSLIASLPDFFRRTRTAIAGLLEEYPEVQQWLVDNTNIETLDISVLAQKFFDIVGTSLTTIVNSTVTAIGSVSSAIVDALISIVFALYSLGNKESLARQARRMLYAFLPEHVCDETVRILRMANRTFSNFISGQCVEAVILGSMFAVTMFIMRLPFVPLVSVIVAVTALVPMVGAFVGCLVGALFILVESPLKALIYIVVFQILQQIENNAIYPKVVGTSIGLPGMWVLMAVTVGGQLGGVGGMLFMIPFTSVLYALLKEITVKRLTLRQIDPEKLTNQPPDLSSRFKEKREELRQKREKNAAETQNQNRQ